MTLRILLAQGIGPKKRVESLTKEAFTRELEPTLLRLGRDNSGQDDALGRFFDAVAGIGLLAG